MHTMVTNPNIVKSGRRVGNTTRLIDEAIQRIFNYEKVYIKCHHTFGQTKAHNREMFKLVISRLNHEHPGSIADLVVDTSDLTIHYKPAQ